MKKLTNYLLETVFDTTADWAVEQKAKEFLSTINRNIRNYEIKNNTIFPKTDEYIYRILQLYSSPQGLLIGTIDGPKYAVPIDEYAKLGLYWGGDVNIEYEILKTGVKLKDLMLNPVDDHTIYITSPGLISIQSQEISKLLDRFIGDTLGSPKNNLVLWLGKHGAGLPVTGLDFLGDKKLSIFNSVIYCVSRDTRTQPDLNDIVNCAADNLMIAFSYDAAFPQGVQDLCKKYNLRITCRDMNNIANGKQYPKLEEKLVPLLTNIAKNNPKTNLYFCDYNEIGNVFSNTLKILYKNGKLSTRYFSSVEL